MILTALVCIVLIQSIAGAATITGRVFDSSGTAIVGASVMLYADSVYQTGTLTDLTGRFSLSINDREQNLYLKITSMGYVESQQDIRPIHLTGTSLDISLKEKPLEFAAVKVAAERIKVDSRSIVTRTEIAKASRYSIVPTNPVSAIVQPEVIRAGSQHSSKLRVLGSSPDYYLNDISIGQDPNHYGVFTIIPGSVVDRMNVYASGTPARFAESSVLEINTAKRFEQHTDGTVNVSFVEATGAVSYGTDRMFALGSLRKSVLDKIIDQFDIKSNRRTIPPTNFQDVFLSTGYQLSPTMYLISDQFHARDYLTYTTDPSAGNPDGVFTYQHSRDNYFGLRLEGYYPSTSFAIRLAGNIKSEDYVAHSGVDAKAGGLQVDLESYQRRIMTGADITTDYEGYELSAGIYAEYIPRRMIRLIQSNWNFLPPDATSDNPYLFQTALNDLYDTYYKWDDEENGAVYASVRRNYKKLVATSGVRIDHFNRLQNPSAMSMRQSLTYAINENNELKAFLGTFAENPTGRILEAYQVLVHANLKNLSPVRSVMTSLGYRYRSAEISMFVKNVRRLPTIIPDYAQVDKNGNPGNGFITIQSSGRRQFIGGSVSASSDSLLNGLLDVYGYYSYTRARKTVSEVTVPYELNSPHVLYLSGHYQASRRISFGIDFTWRSGYAYTPAITTNSSSARSIYSQEYYEDALAAENSSRFPAYVMLNIKGTYRIGRTELFGSIANLLNRKNPIISTYDGFVYDAGFLPSVGVVHNF
ncbi:MAG: TonB-dependent receptor [Candidatus Zixiibacteriota bacterium]